jgi:hypothetical protein
MSSGHVNLSNGSLSGLHYSKLDVDPSTLPRPVVLKPDGMAQWDRVGPARSFWRSLGLVRKAPSTHTTYTSRLVAENPSSLPPAHQTGRDLSRSHPRRLQHQVEAINLVRFLRWLLKIASMHPSLSQSQLNVFTHRPHYLSFLRWTVILVPPLPLSGQSLCHFSSIRIPQCSLACHLTSPPLRWPSIHLSLIWLNLFHALVFRFNGPVQFGRRILSQITHFVKHPWDIIEFHLPSHLRLHPKACTGTTSASSYGSIHHRCQRIPRCDAYKIIEKHANSVPPHTPHYLLAFHQLSGILKMLRKMLNKTHSKVIKTTGI